MNYRFNIDEWLPLFPLKEDFGGYTGYGVSRPCHICYNERLRREMQAEYDWGPAVPVDIFIMAEGEPPDRHVTKLGGLPYRPADSPWPTTPSGAPLTFLAQFDFTDSIDLTGELPGEVLLVFCDRSQDWFEDVRFEWQRLGIENLVPAGQMPEQPHSFATCFGHIYRTVNFPQAEQISSGYPRCRGLPVYSDFYLLQYQATQIGPAPYLIQQEDKDFTGQMLCTISSVFVPERDAPYPWINRKEPLTDDGWQSNDNLMIVDTGCIYISMDDERRLHWGLSSY
jgi:hypothetical protein